jgi:hypothetical protein
MCEIGVNFNNLTFYNEQMRKSMEDKLFFLKQLPAEDNYVFVDFGCADGTMLNILSDMLDSNPLKYSYIGYDISDTMINLAKANFHGDADTDIHYFTDWDDVEKQLETYITHGTYHEQKKYVLILSSVIHEVYSYSNMKQILEFWHHVTNTNFDYIVVRDMCPTKDIDRPTDELMLQQFNNIVRGRKPYDTLINDFEAVHGSIENNKNFIHFLLKYRYQINWEREVKENYFPICVEDLLNAITGEEKYRIMYMKRFIVPFIKQQIYKDFRVDIKDFTHIKAIFKKSF